ncbi:hypothetical protein GCM10008995_11940 [Halobellus salinus]|uniref:Uncharacterized protein n=1 Tax=Halobellus salinus TaxID=931585 RepID=A0A830EMN1_9EURY|nr:hypothetical protein [Halobellus salinus]GGJ03751.1 hypothetical protein GCM10008995_11940 [Halobellus salinus]SMP20989.1 hypothetical protein SAMN06265347_10831 [Halobellus salinus]
MGYTATENRTGFGLPTVREAAAHRREVPLTDPDHGGTRYEFIETDAVDDQSRTAVRLELVMSTPLPIGRLFSE